MNKTELLTNLNKIHTTPMGKERIQKNLGLTANDAVAWCVKAVEDSSSDIFRKGKNWYVRKDDCVITINAHSYTIITAHKNKPYRSTE